ncbi:MAG: hypothetical protein ACI9W4_002513 [Rhodothermales bacterium]|jgi:hypothetical protein
MRCALLVLGLLLAGPVADARGQSMAPYCGTLLDEPEFREAYRRFLQARKSGSPSVARKTAAPPDVGDQQTFLVYIYANNNWVQKLFQLQDKTDIYHAWVEVANLAQMTQQELDTIRSSLLSETPSGSVNPARGVMQNNHDVFGSAPNVDGDGIVDFLFYDIDNQNVGGYVHPGDLEADSGGNGRDILHLDIFQSVSFMPRLIAHEYTHLIHLNYEFDVETFISEGLAEFGMVVNGYTQDNFSYLGFPTEHKRNLFSWRGVDDGNGGRDYDRGRLFFSYLSERIGPHSTGAMLRNDRKGAPGIDSLLVKDGLSLGEVILDFHTANWVFDTGVAAKFGYDRSFSAPLAPIPDRAIDTIQQSATSESSPENSPNLEGGAVNYIYFSELADLTLNFDAYAAPATVAELPGIKDDIRTRLRGRLVARRDDGLIITREVPPAPGNFKLEGNYSEVTLVVTSINPAKTARYGLAGSWRAFGAATGLADAPLPTAFRLDSVYPNPLSGSATVRLQMQQAGPGTVYLVDALGRRAAVVHDGYLFAGTHNLRLEAGALLPGAYLLVAESGSGRSSLSITVVR